MTASRTAARGRRPAAAPVWGWRTAGYQAARQTARRLQAQRVGEEVGGPQAAGVAPDPRDPQPRRARAAAIAPTYPGRLDEDGSSPGAPSARNAVVSAGLAAGQTTMSCARRPPPPRGRSRERLLAALDRPAARARPPRRARERRRRLAGRGLKLGLDVAFSTAGSRLRREAASFLGARRRGPGGCDRLPGEIGAPDQPRGGGGGRPGGDEGPAARHLHSSEPLAREPGDSSWTVTGEARSAAISSRTRASWAQASADRRPQRYGVTRSSSLSRRASAVRITLSRAQHPINADPGAVAFTLGPGVALGALGVLGFSFFAAATRLAVPDHQPWHIAFGRATVAAVLAAIYPGDAHAAEGRPRRWRSLAIVASASSSASRCSRRSPSEAQTAQPTAPSSSRSCPPLPPSPPSPRAGSGRGRILAGERRRPRRGARLHRRERGRRAEQQAGDLYLLRRHRAVRRRLRRAAGASRARWGAATICWALHAQRARVRDGRRRGRRGDRRPARRNDRGSASPTSPIISMFLARLLRLVRGARAPAASPVGQVQFAQPVLTLRVGRRLVLGESIGAFTAVAGAGRVARQRGGDAPAEPVRDPPPWRSRPRPSASATSRAPTPSAARRSPSTRTPSARPTRCTSTSSAPRPGLPRRGRRRRCSASSSAASRLGPVMFDPRSDRLRPPAAQQRQEFRWGPLVVSGDEIETTMTVTDISARGDRLLHVRRSPRTEDSDSRVVGTWSNIVRGGEQ